MRCAARRLHVRRWILIGLAAFAATMVTCTGIPSLDRDHQRIGNRSRHCMHGAAERAGYDYWKLDGLATGGRTLEVAAAIHTDHPGPAATRSYCVGR